MKISARNQVKGRITEIKTGSVNGIVVLDAGGGIQISASITMDSINELNLSVGSEAYAIIKASAVMIGIDG